MEFLPLGGSNQSSSLLGFFPLGEMSVVALLGFPPLGDGNADMPTAFLDRPMGVETLRYEISSTRSPRYCFRDFPSQSPI